MTFVYVNPYMTPSQQKCARHDTRFGNYLRGKDIERAGGCQGPNGKNRKRGGEAQKHLEEYPASDSKQRALSEFLS
jgi:hypothetical protein